MSGREGRSGGARVVPEGAVPGQWRWPGTRGAAAGGRASHQHQARQAAAGGKRSGRPGSIAPALREHQGAGRRSAGAVCHRGRRSWPARRRRPAHPPRLRVPARPPYQPGGLRCPLNPHDLHVLFELFRRSENAKAILQSSSAIGVAAPPRIGAAAMRTGRHGFKRATRGVMRPRDGPNASTAKVDRVNRISRCVGYALPARRGDVDHFDRGYRPERTLGDAWVSDPRADMRTDVAPHICRSAVLPCSWAIQPRDDHLGSCMRRQPCPTPSRRFRNSSPRRP